MHIRFASEFIGRLTASVVLDVDEVAGVYLIGVGVAEEVGEGDALSIAAFMAPPPEPEADFTPSATGFVYVDESSLKVEKLNEAITAGWMPEEAAASEESEPPAEDDAPKRGRKTKSTNEEAEE